MVEWDEEETTYDEHVEIASKGDFNACRLICSSAVETLWDKHLSEKPIREYYCEDQYDMLIGFCKQVMMLGPGASRDGDFQELIKRSYSLMRKAFEKAARNLHSNDYSLFFNEFAARFTLNLYFEETGRPVDQPYDLRTLVLLADLLPQGMEHDKRYQSCTNFRMTYEPQVNKLH